MLRAMKVDLKERTAQRALVGAATLSFLLLTVAVISVYGSPMSGYELSVYASTPSIFWIAILSCLMTGMLLFHVQYFDSFLNSTTAPNSYLVVTLLEEVAYTNTWAATEKFLHSDFYHLGVSSIVDKVYDNSCFTVYRRSTP